MPHIRIGVLGAANIVPNALIKPARRVDEVMVAAIAVPIPKRRGCSTHSPAKNLRDTIHGNVA